MPKRKRTSVENAIESVLTNLDYDTPTTVGEIASKNDLSWTVVDRGIDIAMMIQEYLYKNRIDVLSGRGRKIVLVELRVELSKLPTKVREWFIEEMFFKGDERKNYSTEEAKSILGVKKKRRGRTLLEDSIRSVMNALELEDELSVLELAKRTGLNRRTVERVLDLFTRVQDDVACFSITRFEGDILKRKRPDLYKLDETRMVYSLKRMYLPHLVNKLPDDKEKSLFQMA